jgi:hypothetical protein
MMFVPLVPLVVLFYYYSKIFTLKLFTKYLFGCWRIHIDTAGFAKKPSLLPVHAQVISPHIILAQIVWGTIVSNKVK